jgi:hypothetical protein
MAGRCRIGFRPQSRSVALAGSEDGRGRCCADPANPGNARELCFRGGSVVAEKEAARDGQPGVAHFIGITRIAGEAVPSRQIEFCFRAIDDGFLEEIGKLMVVLSIWLSSA